MLVEDNTRQMIYQLNESGFPNTDGPRTGVPCVSARRRSVSITKLGFEFITHMSNPPYFVSHPLHTYKEDCMLMNKAQTFSISPLVKISFTFTTNSKSHVLLEQPLRQNPLPNGHRGEGAFVPAQALCFRKGETAHVERAKARSGSSFKNATCLVQTRIQK